MISSNFCKLKFLKVHLYNKQQAFHARKNRNLTLVCKVENCEKTFLSLPKSQNHNSKMHKRLLLSEKNVSNLIFCRHCKFKTKNVEFLKTHLGRIYFFS